MVFVHGLGGCGSHSLSDVRIQQIKPAVATVLAAASAFTSHVLTVSKLQSRELCLVASLVFTDD
jgi:hypothetical protein